MSFAEKLKLVSKKVSLNTLSTLKPVRFISTGFLSLDLAVHPKIGGYPVGRITELYGVDSSGKSLLAVCGIIEALKVGKVILLDYESTVDVDYLKALGVPDTEDLIIFQPTTMEEGFEIASQLADPELSMIVLDSISAMLPSSSQDRDFGTAKPGIHSSTLSQCLQKFIPLLLSNDIAMVVTNQVRDTISLYSRRITSGGNSLRHYKHLSIYLKKNGNLPGTPPLGIKVQAKITKNKVGIPMNTADLELKFGEGFNRDYSLLVGLLNLGIVVQTGAWYTSDILGLKIKGKLAFIKELRSNEEVRGNLKSLLLELKKSET